MELPRRTLSLRQPWAWLVIHGGKTIENRRWRCNFRGPFLIHASNGCTRSEYEYAVAWAKQVNSELIIPRMEALPRGCLVGVATIYGMIEPCSKTGDLLRPCKRHPWHMVGQNGLLLKNVYPVPQIKVKGRQRWFDIDDETYDELLKRHTREAGYAVRYA